MGTNFYLIGDGLPSELVADDDPGLHIGKKSYGWDFLFRSHPTAGLTTAAAWRDYCTAPGRRIVDEYREYRDVNEFFAMACARPMDDPNIRRTHTETHQYLRDPKFHVDDAAGGVGFLDCWFC